MPKGHPTTMFVSSTGYDLGQLRLDIREFAISMGFEPILSETQSFPVNPSQTTLENCLEAVRNRADIFVLVVGARYGSLADSGKSITNLEFEEARQKGTPKYVFVLDSILTMLPIWKANPHADFHQQVDTPLLFKFVSELRDSGDTWVFPFSNAQQIITTMRAQLSFLFSDGLQLRSWFHRVDSDLSRLKPRALQICVERPPGWEYLLFARVLADEVAARLDKKLDVELMISLGPSIELKEYGEIFSWISSKSSWLIHTVRQLENILGAGLEIAIGAPGVPGDVRRICHLAIRLAQGYEQLLDWALEFPRVAVDEQFERVVQLTGAMSSNVLREVEEYSQSLYDVIAQYLTQPVKSGLKVTLKLTVPDQSELFAEFKKLSM